MTGTVLLIFSGLIAFVPGRGGQSGTITAFLLQSAGHNPRLSLSSDLVESCPRGCTLTSGKCECALNGTVVLDPLPDRAARSLMERPPGVLPAASTVSDDGWIIHVKNVDEDFAKIDPSRIESATAANVAFGWDDAATCAFDADVEKGLVYAVKFIERGVVTHEQAVAELVVFRAAIQSEILTITLSNGNSLRIKCGGKGCPITISNEALVPTACDQCSDCASGGHFGEYVRLTGGGSGSLRLFRQCGKSSTPGRSEAEICEYATTPPPAVSNRVICPMVVLEP